MQDGVTMNRPVNKLYDLEIDEVSVVDRPANQLGAIAFSKADEQEDLMDFTDENGEVVDLDALEPGDLVYDAEGNEYVFDDDEDDDEDEFEDDEDEEPEVEKALPGLRRAAFATGMKTNAKQAAGWANKNKKPLLAGSAVGGAAGAAGGYALSKSEEKKMAKVEKAQSFGDAVLEELSKAVTDHDRDAVIAKALGEIEIAKAENAELRKSLEEIQDQVITDAFIAKAAEYNLPVEADVFGPILKAVAEVLTDEQLDVLDEVLSAAGDMLYAEIGYVGDTDNDSVTARVDAAAAELVGKSANYTHEQATVALYASNPDAYDAYLAQNGR